MTVAGKRWLHAMSVCTLRVVTCLGKGLVGKGGNILSGFFARGGPMLMWIACLSHAKGGSKLKVVAS